MKQLKLTIDKLRAQNRNTSVAYSVIGNTWPNFSSAAMMKASGVAKSAVVRHHEHNRVKFESPMIFITSRILVSFSITIVVVVIDTNFM